MKQKIVLLVFISMLFFILLTVNAGQTFTFSARTARTVNASSSGFSVPPATEWNKTYGGLGSQRANSVTQTTDGGYILVGNHGVNHWLVKTDSQGNMIWNKTYRKPGFEYVRYSEKDDVAIYRKRK